MSAFRIVDKRHNEFTKKCDNCFKKLNNNSDIMICSGCHYTIYHNKECQKDHWNDHKQHCLLNKTSLNDILQKNKSKPNDD